MKQLIEDYKRRLKTIDEFIDKFYGITNSANSSSELERFNTIASCYRTFISEPERELLTANS